MKAHFSESDIKQLKNHLGQLIPSIKSSHRVEAMARGLGFKTNAALRHQLSQGNIEAYASDLAFIKYLRDQSSSNVEYGLFGEAIVRTKYEEQRSNIQKVMNQHPQLSHFEIGICDPYRKTPKEIQTELLSGRAQMLAAKSIMEFVKACDYLAQFGKRKTINNKTSSYGLKHSAEQYLRDKYKDNSSYDPYIANGMFIAAAIHSGFEYKADGPNASFNISFNPKSKKSVSSKAGPSMRLAGHTGGKLKAQACRNMMVAAINEGLAQNLFGLKEGENFWSDKAKVYHFTFGDKKAIASVTDAGFGELSIHVAVNPTKNAAERITSYNAGLYAGDAFASGYFERRDGAWLQTPKKPCNAIRREILKEIAALDVAANGYADQGAFML